MLLSCRSGTVVCISLHFDDIEIIHDHRLPSMTPYFVNFFLQFFQHVFYFALLNFSLVLLFYYYHIVFVSRGVSLAERFNNKTKRQCTFYPCPFFCQCRQCNGLTIFYRHYNCVCRVLLSEG